MSSIRTDTIMKDLPDVLVHAVAQFAKECKLTDMAEKLLRETAVFFDMKYFKDQIYEGEWDTVERYLMKFTKQEDNIKSKQTCYLIKRQKFLEALARNDAGEARHVLQNELQFCKDSHPESLHTLSVIMGKEKPRLRNSKTVSEVINDIKASRTKLAERAVKLIKVNTKFHRKLELPVLEEGRLLKIIEQGLEWEHAQCKNPLNPPRLKSLYVNHSCDQPDDAPGPSSIPARTTGNIPGYAGSLSNVATTVPLEQTQEIVPNCIASQTPAQLPLVPSTPLRRRKKPVREALSKDQTAVPVYRKSPTGGNSKNQAGTLVTRKSPTGGESKSQAGTQVKRKSLSSNFNDQATPVMKRKSAGKSSDQTVPTLKRKSPTVNQNEKSRRASKKQRVEEASNRQAIDTVQQDPNPRQNRRSTDDLPLDVVMSLPLTAAVETMDFHPSQESMLLYGTITGNIFLWDLRGKKQLAQDSYRIWDLTTSDQLGKAVGSIPVIQRVRWSQDGNYFAVAYITCIVHIYKYLENGNLEDCTEIVAHKGPVFDVAFTEHDNELWVVTCGKDNTVKVWESITGDLRHSFNCFKVPVCSAYPHRHNELPAIYAADKSGTVTILLYHDKKFKLRIPLPNQVSAKIAFSTEGSRLFVGGTSDANKTCILELSQTSGSEIKHAYHGLASHSESYVNYDIVKGKYLAAVDDSKIKFWEIDTSKLLKKIGIEDGLKQGAAIKINKNGSLLAVTTEDQCIKILANAAGKKVLHLEGKRVLDAPSAAAAKQNNLGKSSTMAEEPMNLLEMGSLNEINDCRQCISTRIPSNFSEESVQVSWLSYTKSGRAILVLESNGEHKLWEWQKTATNPNGKATPKSEPTLWKASENMQMMNVVGYATPVGRISCFALPKNRHYVLSTSGGMVYVHDITTFKTIAQIMPPPPVATALAIHPNDSNTLIFGMDDSSIKIYQFRTSSVSSVLNGHTKRVTGFAFSDVLNVLVSAGADCKLCIWSVDDWKMLKSASMKIPRGRTSDTRVQFHQDQKCLLAVHKTQIAIYTVPSLVRINLWAPEDDNSLITHAAYSCDCKSIFATFQNGNVGVLNASSLDLKCRISPASFLPPSSLPNTFPLVVVAHPSEANQFALGLSDGSVVVVEPSEATWENPHPDPVEKEAAPNGTPGITDLDQLVWEESEDEEDMI